MKKYYDGQSTDGGSVPIKPVAQNNKIENMHIEFTIEQIRAFVQKDYQSVAARMTKAMLQHYDAYLHGKPCDGCNVREPFEHRCHGEGCNCNNPVCMERQGRITHEQLMEIVNKELKLKP